MLEAQVAFFTEGERSRIVTTLSNSAICTLEATNVAPSSTMSSFFRQHLDFPHRVMRFFQNIE